MTTVSMFKNWCVEHDQFCVFGRIDSDSHILDRKFDLGHNYHINHFLKAVFGTHERFYKALGYKHDDCHPGDSHFDYHCTGFLEFVKAYYHKVSIDEIGEDQLKKIGDIITLEIEGYLSKFGQKNKVIYSSRILFPDENDYEDFDNRQVEYPEFLNKALILTDKGVFSANLTKTKYNSLKDIEKSAIQMVSKSFELQLEAMTSVYKKEIEALTDKIEDVKEEAFKEGFDLFDIIKKDWAIERGCLIYKKPIYVKKAKYKDKIYILEIDDKKYKEILDEDKTDDEESYEKLEERYFIKGFSIPIERLVNNTSCDDSHHPNASDDSVCIGDLEGKHISEVLKKVPLMLEIANIDSGFSNEATDEITELIERGKLKESCEVWGSEVWKT